MKGIESIWWEFKEDHLWLWEVILFMFDLNFEIKIKVKFWQIFPDLIKIKDITD